MPTDEADAERTAVYHVTDGVVGTQGTTALPDIIAHHEGELTRQGCRLKFVTGV